MLRLLGMVALAALATPAILIVWWVVHCVLLQVCVQHARRFSRRRGLEVRRGRGGPEFATSGIKMESTLIQLDCLDAQQQRRLIMLSVWPFGIRRIVRDEPYPEPDDLDWPEAGAASSCREQPQI